MLAAGSKPLCALGACFTKAKAPAAEGEAAKEEGGEEEGASVKRAPTSGEEPGTGPAKG